MSKSYPGTRHLIGWAFAALLAVYGVSAAAASSKPILELASSLQFCSASVSFQVALEFVPVGFSRGWRQAWMRGLQELAD